MCLYPRLIQNRKYTKTKKNGGIIPAVLDNRVLAVPIGCGRCIECREQEARKWRVRLMEDIKENKDGTFITLTFSNESIKELTETIDTDSYRGYELDNEIATKAVRRFLERWRKENKKSIRHWLITELGHNGTENIHLHGIIYSKDIEKIKKHWKYGFIWTGKYVNAKTINYIIKYVTKADNDHKEYKPKILTSAGIGKRYTTTANAESNKYKEGETREWYKTESGHKIAIPVYYRNKIYTEEEREKLWLEKLDNKTRYVLGQKIDISKGEEEYYKQLEVAREKNKRLGFGNNTIDWNRKKYEEQRRTMLQQKRIEQAEANAKKRPDDPTESSQASVIEVYNGMNGRAIGWGNTTENRTE